MKRPTRAELLAENARLKAALDEAQTDSARIDFLDDRTHLYESPGLDCYADRYEVTIGDADQPLIGGGASLREAIDAARRAVGVTRIACARRE